MKRIMFIVMVAVLMSGCLKSFAVTHTVKDSKGNLYVICEMYDAVKKVFSASVVTNGQEYKCEAAKSETGNNEIAVDFDVYEKTGSMSIVINNVRYTCSVNP